MASTPSIKYPITTEQREAIADVVCDHIGDNMQTRYSGGIVTVWTQSGPNIRPVRWEIALDGTVTHPI